MRWLLVLLLFHAACGGSDAPPPNPPPNPLYVGPDGRDTNFGDIEAPLRSIAKAAQLALDDYDIIVASGTYHEQVTTDRTGTPAQRVNLLADVTGELSNSPPGEVRVDVTGLGKAGFVLSNSSNSVIDGFTIVGSTVAGIVLKSGSNGVTVRNCIITDNPSDGVRVLDSSDVTLFNNLVYLNRQTGIVIAGENAGSPRARLINNTVALNDERGLTIGTTRKDSPHAYLRNNIFAENGVQAALQIRVITDPRSDLGFDGDYDLVSPPAYDPQSLLGAHDIGDSADFADAETGDLHLSSNSPAIDAGDDGSGTTLASFVSALRQRTTTGEEVDTGPPDLGFHFFPD